MNKTIFSTTTLCLSLLIACGDDTSGSGGSGGGGTGGGGTGGTTTTTSSGSGGSSATSGSGGEGGSGGGSANLCATSTPSPNAIGETQASGAYPTPAGGTIADGTYYLSSFEVYPNATADNNVRNVTIEVFGNEFRMSRNTSPAVMGGTFSTNGTMLSFDITCPATLSQTLGYTATATELVLFDTTEPNVQTYTKQ